jgi:hypothetical protein
MNNSNSPDIEKKHREAKRAIRELLLIINTKYVNELRKDPNKEAEFMVSQFSDIHQKITTERKKLRDILQLVQMAIIKMFIEADQNNDLEQKVFDFFNEMQNTNQNQKKGNISSQIDFRQKYLFLDDQEMAEYLRIKTFESKRITKITQALLYEYMERSDSLETALVVWQ